MNWLELYLLAGCLTATVVLILSWLQKEEPGAAALIAIIPTWPAGVVVVVVTALQGLWARLRG